jgi:alkylhydroperoxidase family enzyme
MTEAMVGNLAQAEASLVFTPREKLALQFAELMAVSHQQIDDDFFAALKQEFSAAQIIELGMLIGVFIGYGRLLSVLDLET